MMPDKMKRRSWLLLSLFAAATSWLYVHRLLQPWSETVRLKKGLVIAQMGDLYAPWVGTRELLLHRRNPYSPEVSHEIQLAFYGHAINQKLEPGVEPVNEQRFVYPVYTAFLMAPFARADFTSVHRWAPFILAAFSALTVLFYLEVSHWRPRWETVTAAVLLTLSTPQIVQGMRLQQFALVVGCLLAAGAWCVARNHLASAGVVLALATVKPQMALLPLCWFGIWAAGNWSRRWRLPVVFFISLAALIGAGELILPGWIGYFLAGLNAYRRYFPTSSLLRLALGDSLGEVLGGVIVLALFALAWRDRKELAGSYKFASLLAAFLMGAILALPLFTPFNQVLLILPALLLIRDWQTLPRISGFIFAGVIGWPWIVSAILLLLPTKIASSGQIPLLPAFLVSFVPLFLPLLFMTRRRSPGTERSATYASSPSTGA